jgi:hypothetical protein
MRYMSATAASALGSIFLLSGILLAGCGGSSEDVADPPDDFAITIRHVDGSVPPPGHAEWTLGVDDALQGTLEYTAGYPGAGAPTYKAQFDVESTAMRDLYDGLVDNDLLRDQDPASDPPIGGAAVTATVTADGRTYEIPAYTADGAPLQPLAGLIHRLVPRLVWNDFEKRAEKDYEGGDSG